ncbi:MAG TPA: ribonuclease H-like domain-containing protein [Candidatus Moranbacteria bacterium]|nr:ribonuclease H-like domain-containing protein [Candidatus Moranbacteria bacterium]
MHRLCLDIETLPAEEANHGALRILFDKRKAKKKKECCEEPGDFEQYLLGTSFDGSFGRILCIAYAIDDKPVECLNGDKDEAKMLQEFWKIVESISIPAKNLQWPDYGVQFIGHNVIDFDLRFIYQRSIVNKVKPAYNLNFARYRDYPIYDTMKEWTKWANANIGLEHIALALGIPTPKDGIDGSQVYEFYKKGKINDICEYCKRDVEATREVYKRMTFQ